MVSQLIDRGGFALGPFVHDTTWYGFFFFLGVMVSRHVNAVIGAPVWLFAIGAAVTIAWSVSNALPEPPAMKTLLSAVTTTVGVWTCVWLLARMPLVWPLTLLEWLGRRSIVMYLVHLPALKILHLNFGWSENGWSGYLSLVAAILLICIFATWFYPWIRWLFEWPLPPRSARGADRAHPVTRSV